MVNISDQKISTKALLLDCLRKQAGSPLSGTELAAKAGVSRVAVWKAAETLRKSGYHITGTESEGYRLDNPCDDFLYPWEFPDIEKNIKYWDHTDSTMNRAKSLADSGADSGTIVLAGQQSAGRGRFGRSWQSETGGLFATIIERPSLGILDYYLPAMKLMLAAVTSLRMLSGKNIMVRWPNDIYFEGKKLGGILSELHGESDRISYLNLGIGINVSNVLKQNSKATSCSQLCGSTVSRKKVFKIFLETLNSIALDTEELIKTLNGYTEAVGKKVILVPASHKENKETETGLMHAVFLGITKQGRALVHNEYGKQSFAPGSVSLQF